MTTAPRAFTTGDGTNLGDFSPVDWALTLSVALIWGSSFLWIAIGLEGLHPGALALLRVLLGALALAAYAPARRHVDLAEWRALGVVGVCGNAAPAIFFAFAEQRVETSVAGMLNAVSPLMVLALAVALTRRAPVRRQLVGLLIGFAGAIMMAIPNVTGADAEPLGVFFVLLAITGYALSNTVIPPLQQAFGGPAVILRAQIIASIVLLPYGLYGLGDSHWRTDSVVALLILGIVGTGAARAMFATLTGRVGAPRASIMGYLVPVVAIVVGVVVRSESIHPMELAGTAIVLIGAGIISRQS